jgi:predicted O-linked N-acetylglucosamine transferase (SPINDLY family)
MQGSTLHPLKIDALFAQGFTLHQQGEIDQARAIYEQILERKPRHFDALHLLGVIAAGSGKPLLAVDWIGKSIKVNPGVAAAHSNLGAAYKDLMQFDAALGSYDRAIALKPELAEAHCHRGIVLHQMRRLDEALVSYAHAIRIKPDYAEAYFNRGEALKDQRRFSEALASYEEAIRLRPDVPVSWCGHGIVLSHLRRLDEAVKSYLRAIEIAPDYVNAYLNLGSAFKDLGRVDEALFMYDKAVAIRPDLAEAYTRRGALFHSIARFDDALASYQRAFELRPHFEYLLGLLIHLRHRLCAWDEYDADVQRLDAALESQARVSPPFIVSTVSDVPHRQRRIAEVWTQAMYPPQAELGPIACRPKKSKIRLGYYSADFHDHATCCLMAELFELHDKERFELFAFSFGPDMRDAMRMRVCDAFDQFIDVRSMSDIDVARLSRELEIDVAIDLKGHTQNARPGIFSYRCAPVQVNYLGYPGTMGADYMDYLIADKVLIPAESQIHYSEKIVYLPHSYQVNDAKRKFSDKVLTRESVGLPQHGVVFCCFNNSFKITPQTFDGWMRILKAVEGSVLWLLDDNPSATRNLQSASKARGVDPSRLVFGPRLPQSEHLARHRFADLFLDTLPCNAHTTASDALWSGVPVLTLVGQSFAGRVAASLLSAMDLPEMIAYSQGQYERLAIDLARNPAAFGALKEKVAMKRLSAPLYNTALFTRDLENAYSLMHARHLAGLAPDHLFIPT